MNIEFFRHPFSSKRDQLTLYDITFQGISLPTVILSYVNIDLVFELILIYGIAILHFIISKGIILPTSVIKLI